MRRALTVLVASSALVACAHDAAAPPPGGPEVAPIATVTSATAVQPASPVQDAPSARDDGRLPALATPVHYAISFDVDPTQPRFHGVASIDVDVAHATPHIVLHGRDLNITDVSATFGSKAVGGTFAARVAHGGTEPEEIVLTFAEALPKGRATLTITYDAPFATDLSGLYRVKEGANWYAFTQFEATDARRAFPCFDEPAFKATYDLSIRTPSGMLAVANTPERAHNEDAGAIRYEFATTPPVSSYLVAFAVGDFDVRDGVKDPVPVRLITVKGKSPMGGFALDAAAGLVKTLGEYFALPYPFPKLDIVAVPDFAAGAMENPGLITFRESLLLLDPTHSSLAAQRNASITIAHELAHIWFGDLVTMQWWDDVWLNEGFATWMETRATDAWRPEYAVHTEAVAEAQHVMDLDSLASARAVRQPVATRSEIEESFDGISYEKGAAVLAMVEHWIGEVAFQRGIRDYVRAHAWKNATADDLLGALDHASGRNVSAMAATFLNRAGVPVVAVKSSCVGGKASFDLTQSTWQPLGALASSASPWRIPVCIHEASGKDECTDLTETHALFASKAACGAPAFPNASEAGYYRFSLSERDARAVARDAAHLDAASRVGLISNLWAEARAGELSPDVLLEVLPAFDHETDGRVVMELVNTLYGIDRALVDEAAHPAFRAYVAARMAGQKRRLGWQRKAGDDDGSALARPHVLQILGEVAHDPATIREADLLATRWLADPTSVDADVAPTAVHIASTHGDGALWDQLRVVAKSAKTPANRIIALQGLGAFEDAKVLTRTFDLLPTDEVKMQDMRYVLGGMHDPTLALFSRTEGARAFFGWLSAHWEAARAKLPGDLAWTYTRVLEGVASAGERDAELAFLQPHMADVGAAKRPLAEEAEAATARVELRAHGAASVTRFLGAKGAAKK